MNFIFQDSVFFRKKESNINGLTYLPEFTDSFLNNRGHAFKDNIYQPSEEITDCNLNTLQRILDSVNVQNVVEIGVARNGSRSFTHKLIQNKKGIYCGIDIEDKSFLNDSQNNIHTIKKNSFNQTEIRKFFKKINLKSVSVLFIDGDHSVNGVINDWLYTDLLEPKGVVVLHDTNHHPGPNLILDAINKSQYNVESYCNNFSDYGLAAAYKI